MNTQKYGLHNSGLLNENDRSLYGEYDTTSRSRIDFERTEMNYNLCPHEQYTREQMVQIHEQIRGKRFPKNGVLFGQTVLTLPRDYTGDREEFFRTAYDGLRNLYGLRSEDIVSAWVHLDETNPHLHFTFLPVHREEGRVTMSWEKVMPKRMYEQQHQKLEQFLSLTLGEVHLLNGGTLGFDVQALTPEQKEVSMEIYRLKSERDSVYAEIGRLEAQRNRSQRGIEEAFSMGDLPAVEGHEKEWEQCTNRIQELVTQRKEVSRQIGVLCDQMQGERSTATQREIIELVSDVTHLDDRCMQMAHEVARMKGTVGEIRAEIARETHSAALLQRVDSIIESAEGQIPYPSYTEGLFKNRRTVYEVPEEDMRDLMGGLQTTKGIQEQLLDLERRERALRDEKNDFAEEVFEHNQAKDQLRRERSEVYAQSSALRQRERDLDRLIDEKSIDRFKKFLSQYPDSKRDYDRFMQVQRERAFGHGGHDR